MNRVENEADIEVLLDKVRQLFNDPKEVKIAEHLEVVEKEILALTNQIAATVIAGQIQFSLDSEESKSSTKRLLDVWPHKLNSKGKKGVWIQTSTGIRVYVLTSYYTRKGKRLRKKRRPGVYLGLLWLGIHEHCTPSFGSEVSLLVTMLGSMEEATNVLAERGISMDVKSVRRISYRLAERTRLNQSLSGYCFEEDMAGRRVVVSIDGGRIRLREKKRGPKTKKGRNRYNGAWREPKLFIVYVVDKDGKIERSFQPVIDAIIRGPDALFSLLIGYLEQLNLTEADQVLFIADGAKWIWTRIPSVVQKLRLKPAQVSELIDFYHAVEHLGKVAALRKIWTAKQRKSWVKKHRHLLLKGQVEKVVTSVKAICRGRGSKEIRTQRDYFVRNTNRMAYDRIKEMSFPIGSGCVESAIRRVVNLRLKGPCTFWCKANAEAVLLLRCYWKAGRWSQLKRQANSIIPAAFA
jgi:hypothetical protein